MTTDPAQELGTGPAIDGGATASGDTAGEWGVTASVGLTALLVAAARAVEADRPDALVRDEFAAGFVARADAPVPMPTTVRELGTFTAGQGWQTMTAMMAVRTRVFDDLLRDADAAGLRQVVVLASGLDTRTHRLDWAPGTTVFEIDQPGVLRFKQEALDATGAPARAALRLVPADLRQDWPAALQEASLDTAAPTSWLVEGLLPYLPPDAEADLFDRITALSAPGSRIAVEAIDHSDADALATRPEIEDLGRSVGFDWATLFDARSRPPVTETLQRLGWTTRARRLGELAAGYGRPFAGPATAMPAANLIVDAHL
ncbi:SAM-dependent methyltransferase [Pseudonocardia phyllosphaerae]|uniref:SAM-dependent methyltransferase n=1 Tax=Pseudonocardia phyllosphaerae TaxID=3390502 RepID=UPI00397A3926